MEREGVRGKREGGKRESSFTDSLMVDLVPVFRVEDEEMTPPVRREDFDCAMSQQVATLVHLPDRIIAPLDAP